MLDAGGRTRDGPVIVRGLSERFFLLLARLPVHRPWSVLLGCLLVTALAAYASTRISINTSTEGIFSPNVEFIRNANKYEQDFPANGEPIVAVINAPDADRAQAAARTFAEALRDNRLFREVAVPGSETYFRRAGLLFLSTQQLEDLREQLRRAAPALTVLSNEPDLFGVAKFLDLITAGVKLKVDIPPQLSRFVHELAETTRLQAAGGSVTLSWNSLFQLGKLQERGKQQFVLAYPVLDKTTVKRVAPALDAARAAARAVSSGEAGGDVRIRLTGQPVLDQQELDGAFSGAIYASIISFALVVLTFVLGIRSRRLILILTVTMIVGSVWTSGLAAVAVAELNLISLAFGVLFFAIGVDFGTHLGLRYMAQLAGATPPQAITRSVTGEGPAIALSVLCASIGFLSFLATDYLGLAQLGLISALGMVAAFAVTLIPLPAMLAAWPPSGQVGMQDLSRFSAWLRRRAVLIVCLATVGTLASAAVATRARVDVNPLNLQDPDTEAVRTYRALAHDPATSPYEVNAATASLHAARELAQRLRALEGVAEVRTVETFIPADQEQKRAAVAAIKQQFAATAQRPARELGIPELGEGFLKLRGSANTLAAATAAANLSTLQAEAEAVVTALGQFAEREGPSARKLYEFNRALASGLPALFEQLRETAVSVTLDDLPAEFRRDWLAPDGRARVQVLPVAAATDGERMEEFAARILAVAPGATGVPLLIAGAAQVVRESFAQAVVITAIGIIAIIAIVRRRLSDVILILTPLVLASIWTLAGAALLGLSFNFANVIVIPVLLGIGVASAIHVVSRAREAAKRMTNGQGGFLESSTPRAVLLTDANTALAFAALAVSPHRGLFSLGVLLALATSLSLVASLIVLPALLILLQRRHVANF